MTVDTIGEAGEHKPVMVDEVLCYLNPQKGEVIVDGTIGDGGHAESILEHIVPGGRLIGIDRDPAAIARASRRLGKMAEAVCYHRENFRSFKSVIGGEGIDKVDGILLDLGVSSMQLDDPSRGFSFRHDGPIDMRMDPDAGRSAAEIVNEESEDELTRILYVFGEERWARRIAKFIVEARERRPIRTTGELEQIVKDAVPAGARRGGKHPARRTFQALRIAVNNELENLKNGIIEGIECLAPSGRIVVLSYQSLEDRIVKSTFNSLAKGTGYPPDLSLLMPRILDLLTRKPVRPTPQEMEENPRSKSAKLRAAVRNKDL
ncbi:MAG: 16S rRNA (cytosine(1402)-N(4))-methyltransferase [Candidatus Anoxymicrobium japonicum]|uniref:Ribosomal RNA small subunit methyltransferase H n=1 Tax=Candidatus Anoxymicrobium japonicum TaxID=2013648 RepID=A0A2N3G6F7_9ACTN|nr:MAG: 16S rRNA (cytosine(1402)-N(4))-methyltransferase [Candidatus Anoxymicrobium japonicum]